MRSRAAEWGIDPGRLGILGFSAGGVTAAYTALAALRGLPLAELTAQATANFTRLFGP
mgnify:CR=1 FL=1